MCRIKIILFLFVLVASLAGHAVADTIPLQAQFVSARTVALSWTLSSPGTITQVLRQYPGEDSFTEIGIVSGDNYTDRHGRCVCGDTVRYSIVQNLSASENRGFAAVYVDDTEPTAMAEWGVVTVDADLQSIVLRWEASPDSDIMGYLVCEGTPSMAIDTVFGRFNTEYTPAQHDAGQIYEFRICAFDSCRQASPLTDVACNMVLTLSSEPCSRQFVARWNLYQNMPQGIGRYELWVSENGNPFRNVAESSNGETTFTVGENTVTVQAFVRAVSSDGLLEALSNRPSVTLSSTERPSYLYLRKVSIVDRENAVLVIGQTDPSFMGDYRIYRSDDIGNNTIIAHPIPAADGTLQWIDYDVALHEKVYTYWIGVYDGCGVSEIVSQKGSTILPVIDVQGGYVNLSWNAYQGWTGTTSYEVWQLCAGEEWWQLIGGGTTADMSLPSSNGTVTYRVVAYEGTDSRYERSDSLKGVDVTYHPHTDIWVPNAFTPLESSNNIFCPKTMYAEHYSLTLYNRYGLLVFSTDEPSEGWDGTYNGIMQPAGAYVYKITYRQNDGTEQQQIGTVLLIW